MKKQISEVYPVSVFIKEEMEARGWTEKELIKHSWLRPAKIKLILEDKMIITKTMAKGLGRAFGTSTEYWLNLQKLWYTGLEIAIEDEMMAINLQTPDNLSWEQKYILQLIKRGYSPKEAHNTLSAMDAIPYDDDPIDCANEESSNYGD